MIDIMPIIYVSLIGLGLIGAQAAFSDKRFMLVLSAPPQLANTGYSRDVIEDLFLSDMEDVFDTRSVIATPAIASVREKTILGAMADIAHMGDLAFVIQQKIGGNPFKVTANFVVEGNKTQVLLSGNSTSQGQFQQVIVGSDGDFRYRHDTAVAREIHSLGKQGCLRVCAPAAGRGGRLIAFRPPGGTVS